MFNLRRVATVAIAASMAVAAMAGPGAAAPSKPTMPTVVGTVTLTDSAGRNLTFDASRLSSVGTLRLGTVRPATDNTTAAITCDSWLEVHFTLTDPVFNQLLLRWVHRVRSCVDGTNVTSLAERKEYVSYRAASIQARGLLGDFINPAPVNPVVTSYVQRGFQYCSLDILPCLYTWQPGNFIYSVGNGQMLWNPSPWW